VTNQPELANASTAALPNRVGYLHVEYAERGKEYGILFIFSLFCEYIYLEYTRNHVIHRVNQAEYATPIQHVGWVVYLSILSKSKSISKSIHRWVDMYG